MAFDANAEDRLTRGFTSMTTYDIGSGESPGRLSPTVGDGARPNWMLHPPSIPSARMIRRLADRSIWYSLSDSVWLGAITMESPVWTPIASKFSMLQIVMHVSAESRITSYSTSRHPRSERSSSTWDIGLAARPDAATSRNSSIVYANPPPVPPSVYAGRTTSGKPMRSPTSMASSSVCTVSLGADGSPNSISN